MFNLRTPPPQPARERVPFNADRLWSIFLFGLLPLVFIPCLFVPSSLDVIRYVFLGLCVLGLGGMWYRQMFSSVTRLIVSMVYVALCIVTVAMMMQGGRDVLRTGAPGNQPASIQTSAAPDAAPDGSEADARSALPEPTTCRSTMCATPTSRKINTLRQMPLKPTALDNFRSLIAHMMPVT